MATKVNTLGVWAQARSTLATNLQSTLAFLENEAFSADPNSPYQQAEAASQKLLAEMRALAVTGLKEVDDQIAQSGVVAEITAAAAEAKMEADRLANAAKTIDGIRKAVDAATSVVTKLNGLPFL